MRKKILFLIFCIISIFCNVDKTYAAQNHYCDYVALKMDFPIYMANKSMGVELWFQTIQKSSYSANIWNEIINENKNNSNYQIKDDALYYVDADTEEYNTVLVDTEIGLYTKQSLYNLYSDTCPEQVTICAAKDSDSHSYDTVLVAITNETSFLTVDQFKDHWLRDGLELITIGNQKYKDLVCKTSNYVNDNGNGTSSVNHCESFNTMKAQLVEYYATSKTEYKASKDKLTSYCSNVLNNKDVLYKENELDACIEQCLSLSDTIANIENDFTSLSSCGISDKLVIWIANIVRWVKYIIPVAVIVLGIIDFIKAMAGDKDDELKKAQGRFIKRLIAAALIFIAPLIIEFVLDKMGFDANGCGIIDL